MFSALLSILLGATLFAADSKSPLIILASDLSEATQLGAKPRAKSCWLELLPPEYLNRAMSEFLAGTAMRWLPHEVLAPAGRHSLEAIERIKRGQLKIVLAHENPKADFAINFEQGTLTVSGLLMEKLARGASSDPARMIDTTANSVFDLQAAESWLNELARLKHSYAWPRLVTSEKWRAGLRGQPKQEPQERAIAETLWPEVRDALYENRFERAVELLDEGLDVPSELAILKLQLSQGQFHPAFVRLGAVARELVDYRKSRSASKLDPARLVQLESAVRELEAAIDRALNPGLIIVAPAARGK